MALARCGGAGPEYPDPLADLPVDRILKTLLSTIGIEKIDMGKFAIAAILLIIGIDADHPIETYLLKNPASGLKFEPRLIKLILTV
jgi:hypothetical protein